MDPRGTVGRIHEEDHYPMLHTKYERSCPCGFEEDDLFTFFFFFVVSLWELSCCHGNQSFNPTWLKT